MAFLHLRILGEFEAQDAAGHPIEIHARKNRALLAVLALSPAGSSSRERLAGMLWSGSRDEQARNSLRQALVSLRRDFNGLHPLPLTASDDRVTLDLDAVEIDAVEFQRCAGMDDVDALRRAVALCRGELLADIGTRDPAFEEWLAAERRRLNQLTVAALEKLWTKETGRARIDVAQRLVALDPLRESSHRALMQALAECGETALALQQYTACRDLLKAELDVAPEKETEDLRQQILKGRTARSGPGGAPEKVAIAVLPFENLSDDPAQDLFADGIAEDIITQLSRFRELQVIARKSSFQFRGKGVDVKEAAAKLGVGFVVEGSVRKIGGRVRISVQLIDVDSNSHVWADRYDREVIDVFEIQDEITRMIVGRLVTQLAREELERAKRKHPESLKAYELWLTGAELHERATAEAHDQARELYRRALEIDPNFARAHAGLAEITYLESLMRGWGLPRETAGEALEHARRAVECDANDADAHVVLGWAHLMLREFERARRHLDRAGELNPNDADICMSRATGLAFLGEPEAGLEWAALAMRLNPYCPDWYLSDKAVIHFLAGDAAAALAIYDEMGELYPHSVTWRAAAAAEAGRLAEARRLIAEFVEKAKQLWVGDPGAGPADYARWIVDELPLRREGDKARLWAGLRAAGLEV